MADVECRVVGVVAIVAVCLCCSCPIYVHYTMFALRRASRSVLLSARRRGVVGGRRGFAAEEMPTPRSAEAKLFEGHPRNEGWETTVAWWYSSSFVLIVMILSLQPETGIDAWAQKEAATRLEMKKAGIQPEFGKHYQDVAESELKSAWDVFSHKALRMTEDDDDEDEEEEEDEDEDDD